VSELFSTSQTAYDAAGRVVRTIQNYEDGVIESAEPDRDVTVATTYTPGHEKGIVPRSLEKEANAHEVS
jgi:hypothetical protein